MSSPRTHVRSGHPSFLDLPWEDPISSWVGPRQVEMPKGVHRHPIVFVTYDQGIYAIKELPIPLARREHQTLSLLEERGTRSARTVGLVERGWLDDQEEASGAVITRYVDHAFPYRELVDGSGFGERRGQVREALAVLLVELHLAGCFWGDCSLSNALYRYDAGAVEAVMIDAETSSVYPGMTQGQRTHDLEIMVENVAGEMSDIAAELGDGPDGADLAFGEDVASKYGELWEELSRDLVIQADEGYRIRERIARLNEMGFSVDDVDMVPTRDGRRILVHAVVAGRTFHSHRLRELTGIDASENQARQLLSDINYHLGRTGATTATMKSVGVVKWRVGVLEPALREIASVFQGNPVQGYCDLLDYRIREAGRRGSDVPDQEALRLWIEAGMPGHPLADGADPI